MKKDLNPYLSVIIPLFNEQEVIPELISQLFSVCRLLNKSFEVIFIDDGSLDRTPDILKEAAKKDPRVKIAKFSRNFGHQAAFSAGLDLASGKFIITMDGDLQHPPQLIPEFLRYAEEGYDIVIGERISKSQNLIAQDKAKTTVYKLLSAITNLEFRNASDFALYSERVVRALRSLPEKERFLRGMVQWIGFKKKYLPYAVQARQYGKAKYNLKKLFALIMSGVTSFSAFPLRLAFWVGLGIFISCIVFSAYVIIDHYINPNPLIAGWATVVILISGLGGIQLMVLGVVGEYLYKMFNEIKGRPLYIVSETHNVDKERIEPTPYGVHIL